MSAAVASTLAPVSVVDALVLAMRSRILDGELAPGSAVTEVEAARTYGVARPTAKAAIRTLVHEGLLRQDANHAAYVPRLAGADVHDLFLVRLALELAVIDLVGARHRPADLAAMRRAITTLSALGEDAPTSAFVEADLAFHRALVAAANSERLSRIYGQLIGEIHLCMMQTRTLLGSSRIAREHTQILKAIESADTARGAARMRAHLAAARQVLVSAQRADPVAVKRSGPVTRIPRSVHR
jgi:DNA-binding GntR family transcriptional regulator